jgi:hypothetical protein
MPVQAIIEHGARPDYDVTDETGVPTREYVERKNSDRMVAYVRAENPKISFEFNGIMVGDTATVQKLRCLDAARRRCSHLTSSTTRELRRPFPNPRKAATRETSSARRRGAIRGGHCARDGLD